MIEDDSMTEPRPSDAMIEIGDMDDDPTPPGPEAPRVVIEYRDRGVPWMLIPPLVAAAVVVAVVVALGVNARLNPRRPAVVVVPASKPETAPVPEVEPTALAGANSVATAPSLAANAAPVVPGVPDPIVIENPPELPPAPETPPATTAVAAPAPAPVEPAPPSAPPVLVGLDPALLDQPLVAKPDDRAPGMAPRDPGVAMTQSAPPAAKPEADLPEEVDPDLLPPDPTQSLAQRRQRAIQARRELEGDRVRFHAAIAQAIRQQGRRAAPKIEDICKEMGQSPTPLAKERAHKLLGKTGIYAGADTGQRIAVLRRLGFAEPSILGDIFDVITRHESPQGRNTPSNDVLTIQAAQILLKHPPVRPAATTTNAQAKAQPVSAPRP